MKCPVHVRPIRQRCVPRPGDASLPHLSGERKTSCLVGGRNVSNGECAICASARWPSEPSTGRGRTRTVQRTTCTRQQTLFRISVQKLTTFIRSSLSSSSPSSPNARHCVNVRSSVKMIRFVARLCSTPATFCSRRASHLPCRSHALTTATIPSTSTSPASSCQNSRANTSAGSLPALKQSWIT